MNDTHVCLAETTCKQYDRTAGHANPTDQPLCDPCIEWRQPDIKALLFDYLDLAQLHEASMSQAITEKTGGSKEKQMLLVGHVEALQAEIVHVLTTWEHAIRAYHRLSNPGTFAPLWRTTVYDHINLTTSATRLRGARAGTLVQRAVGIITTHLRRLANLPPITVCPTGIEDEPTVMYGWEAVLQLADLHSTCRSVLGRTRRTFWIPGECWACDARPALGVDGPLLRSEPIRFEDPMQVSCDHCHASRPYPDYETYMATLMWPGQATDDLVRVAA
jgi:hypothetical protein